MAPILQETRIPAHKPPLAWYSLARITDFRDGTASSGYFYPDSTIAGFSHTHLSGTGAGDLYDISFMPVTLPYKEAEAPLGIYSKFSHDDESAYAGYYQVRLKDYNINVELTATERCGIQRYILP